MLNIFNKYKTSIAIISLIISMTLILIGIFTVNDNITKSFYVIFGEIFCILGIIIPNINTQKRYRGFEKVSTEHKKNKLNNVFMPIRATRNSCAYDFFANDSYIVQPNETVKIFTDLKAYMQDDECLILNVRSSMGGKFMLANTQGWVDSDYYNNENNEGNIGIFLKNISDEPQIIERGSRIAQGMFVKYVIADNDNTTNIRIGGFGSTND